MARELGQRGWYDKTMRDKLARAAPQDDETPARELGAGGGMTNQRILAPPGDVRGIEHDPETSKRLRRQARATKPQSAATVSDLMPKQTLGARGRPLRAIAMPMTETRTAGWGKSPKSIVSPVRTTSRQRRSRLRHRTIS